MIEFENLNTVTLKASVLAFTLSASPNAYSNPGLTVSSDRYQILRNGKPVGEHTVTIEKNLNATRVISKSQISVGFLGFTVYKFNYSAVETWDASGIMRLDVTVDDDGTVFNLSGNRTENQFKWSFNDGKAETVQLPIFPTSHWNPKVLQQNRVLNTLTGSINDIAINFAPTSNPLLPDLSGKRYSYSGELRLDAWYDEAGQWLGMRFKGSDDSDIEYRCTTCSDA